MKYNQYLELKKMVLDGKATVDYVREELEIPLFVARCLVKDWQEQEEKLEETKLRVKYEGFLKSVALSGEVLKDEHTFEWFCKKLNA